MMMLAKGVAKRAVILRDINIKLKEVWYATSS
jgi:hypothetical protein